MDYSNEELREALRAAELSVQLAVASIVSSGPFDDAAMRDLEGAQAMIRRWRLALEAGKWPGRNEAAVPTREDR